MELIQRLMDRLGLDETTARSGLGLVLKIGVGKLDAAHLESLKKLIPETDALIEEAPSSGVLGGLGGLASKLGRKKDLGDLAKLMGGFSKLGIDKECAIKAGDIVAEFIRERGDEKLNGLLDDILPRVKG